MAGSLMPPDRIVAEHTTATAANHIALCHAFMINRPGVRLAGLVALHGALTAHKITFYHNIISWRSCDGGGQNRAAVACGAGIQPVSGDKNLPTEAASTMSNTQKTLKTLIGESVVLYTAGPIVYLGTLLEVRPDGFWLGDADLRDGTEGHVTKERYICECRERGVRPNRKRIFVFAHAVISISPLNAVITD